MAELQLNGATRGEAVEALKASGGDVSAAVLWLVQQANAPPSDYADETLADLAANGLSKEDAKAALDHCSGDVAAALGYAVECMEAGGPAAVARRESRKKSRRAAAAAAASARDGGDGGIYCDGTEVAAARRAEESRLRAETAEVAAVLAAFESSSGGTMQASRVVAVERVQNLDLASQYCRRVPRALVWAVWPVPCVLCVCRMNPA